MGLKRLTDRIYYLEHEPETDRPMLAYIRGDKWSLAIDAGYSSSHVADFYGAIEAEHLKKPDFTVISPIGIMTIPSGCTRSAGSALPMKRPMSF